MVQASPRIDFEEWLRLEAESDTRHEYLRGEVYAKSGAALRHGRITVNIGRRLDEATEGGPCRVYTSDAKVRVEAADAGFYPDIVVSCDPRDVGPLVLLYPRLVIEVSSPSTAAYDRGLTGSAEIAARPSRPPPGASVADSAREGRAHISADPVKFAAYRQLEILQEYVVVEPDVATVDVFRRGADGTWTFRSFAEGDVVELPSIQARVPVAQIYDRLPPVEAPGTPQNPGEAPSR